MRADRVPVLVGVGQVRGNRDRVVAAAREPLALILDAIAAAVADAGPAGAGLLGAVDTIDTVRTTSWAHADMPALLAARLGVHPARGADSRVGGHFPALLLERSAARVAAGQSRVTLIAGGEAMASLLALRRAGLDPVRDAAWSAEPGGPPSFDAEDLGSPAMRAAGLVAPTRVYPLLAGARRRALGIDPESAAQASARLYAAFSRAAAANPAAWDPRPRDAAEIAAVGPGNRMVCEPYPLAQNANPMVDQAAAVLVTSLAAAREHGVAADRVVHVWGGAGAVDAADLLARPSLARSAALADVLDRCLAATGLTAGQLDVIDVYSCFPVVPELVADHLGLEPAAVAGVTGGHSAFGGPLSSYTLHALVAVVAALRAGARTALVHGNGGYLTHQQALVLARDPHPDGYVGDPEPRDTAGPAPRAVPVPAAAEAVAVEAATVEYGRDGAPVQGFLVARTADGARFAAATPPGDAAAAMALSLHRGGGVREIVGTTVRVRRGEAGITVEAPR